MRAARSLLVAVVATLAVVTVGLLTTGDDSADSPATDAPSVALTDLDTTSLVAARDAFCETVPEAAVAEALGSEAADAVDYGNGQRVRVTATTKDVAHEFGCSWSAADGTLARAWVFAPPVTPARAADLVESLATGKGCEELPDAAAYGVPSVGLTCTDGDTREQSYRGLFGDAWLTCSLSAPLAQPAAGLADRASRWCASVAQAATAG